MKRVAVITRTKDRPVLLKRALESVASQSFRDFVWVIINDGGQASHVEETAQKARDRGLTVDVIHNEKSLGMEAASNTGIRKSRSEFIAIHDDDDTWEPAFLQKAVSFLDSPEGVKYAGAITRVTLVQERMKGESCDIIFRSPYGRDFKAVYISDIAGGNLFPPISFLYRREFYAKAGGYDETLPVLGDWDFNLRFLLHGDIAVIPEPLATYHTRVDKNPRAYGNTVVHGIEKHYEYDMIIRNRLLREDLRSNTVGLGFLVGFGRELRELQNMNVLNVFKVLLLRTRAGNYIIRRFLKQADKKG